MGKTDQADAALCDVGQAAQVILDINRVAARAEAVNIEPRLQTLLRTRERKLSTINAAWPQPISRCAQRRVFSLTPSQPCMTTTAGNGPAPAGVRSSYVPAPA
jgi:hypothetical protein